MSSIDDKMSTKGSQSNQTSDGNDVELGDPVSKEEISRDPNIVDWDGPDDPENPLNWPTSKKLSTLSMVSIITFLSWARQSAVMLFVRVT